MREGIYSRGSATGREKLEIIWVRGQNIEIFIKNVKFQRAVAQIRMTPQAVILAESAVNIIK
jgi:hypothetical protein